MKLARLFGAGLVVVVAACSSTKGHATAPTASAPSTTAAAATTSVATTVPVSTSAPTARSSTSAGGPARCHSSQLSAALSNASGAAGTIYSHLAFTNTSSATCTMSGYPGVSFVDGSGHQIGAPAMRTSNFGGGTIILAANGGKAAAVFAYHDALVGNSPACMTPAHASGLRVYPPGETAALFVAGPTLACPDPAATGLAEISAVANPSSLPV